MNPLVAILLLPLSILAIGIWMAVNTNEPMWLVFAAVLAMAAGYIARRTLGS